MTAVTTLGVPPLLVRSDDVRGAYPVEDLDRYRASGGYATTATPANLLARIDATGLRGRGGAGFPLAVKLRTVASRPGRPVVVANGEEGEPGSVKDRYLMRTRPHLVIDGLCRAAAIVGAEHGHVYVSDPLSAAAIRDALAAAPPPIGVTVAEVAPAYVAGEETALVRFLDGGPALPVAKPPRPYEHGVGGAPTLIANVETLAHVALLAAGTDATDHVLITLAGGGRPRLIEAANGISTRALAPNAAYALVGGMFGGLARINGDAVTGVGAIHVAAPGTCPVTLAGDALDYLAAESSRQCGVCVSGTRSLADAVAAMRSGTAEAAQAANVERWAAGLPGRGACGLLDAAARVAGSLARHFPDTVAGHLGRACPACAGSPRLGGARFTVAPPEPLGIRTYADVHTARRYA
jgi:NADH:ubiquinone oxidoreductase subunit F (NADH-binding)